MTQAMKVKIRFMPMNEASRDLVVACGHKQVLDVTLKVKKGWKSVIEHLLSKWNSIDKIDKRLQLFLLRDGELPSTNVNFNHEYFFEESVDAVLMRDTGFRNAVMTPQQKMSSVENIPLVFFSYSIAAPESVGGNSDTIVTESSLPAGFTVMDDSWMHAFSLITNPLTDNTGDQNGKVTGISLDLDNFSALKRHDMSLPGFSASVMGRFSSGTSQLLIPSHSLLGGGLLAQKSTADTEQKLSSSSSSASRIYANVEKAILSGSPSTVPKASSESSATLQNSSPNASNLSLVSSGGEEGSNLSINMLKVRYKKKSTHLSDTLVSSTLKPCKSVDTTLKGPSPAAVEDAAPISHTDPTMPVRDREVSISQEAKKDMSIPESPKARQMSTSLDPMTPERCVVKVENSSSFMSPGSERKRKRVRFESENSPPLVSPSKFSPAAKATARSVSKGQVYIGATTKEEPKFSQLLNRKGRSRPELRRIKPTFVRPLSTEE